MERQHTDFLRSMETELATESIPSKMPAGSLGVNIVVSKTPLASRALIAACIIVSTIPISYRQRLGLRTHVDECLVLSVHHQARDVGTE